MWIKVLIASVPAAVIGLLFNDVLDRLFYKPLPVAIMLIVYGILFIIVEKPECREKTVRDKDFTVKYTDASVDWIFPDAGVDSGNLKIRGERSLER